MGRGVAQPPERTASVAPVQMKELSERSGVPVPSIKYYLREGLLDPGEATGATRARYEDRHLERLRLIRVLREIGDIPVARIAAVVRAVEDESLPLQDLLATAHHALGPEPAGPVEPPGTRQAVLRHLRTAGWNISSEAPSLQVLAAALDALRTMWGPDVGPDVFDAYADAAFDIARFELDSVDATAGRTATVQQIIVGTVVFEQALVALRRLAEEHHSHRRFASEDDA